MNQRQLKTLQRGDKIVINDPRPYRRGPPLFREQLLEPIFWWSRGETRFRCRAHIRTAQGHRNRREGMNMGEYHRSELKPRHGLNAKDRLALEKRNRELERTASDFLGTSRHTRAATVGHDGPG